MASAAEQSFIVAVLAAENTRQSFELWRAGQAPASIVEARRDDPLHA